MVKLCHEKMLIFRCIFCHKTESPPEKNLTLPPEKIQHPDKKLNSQGIILISWKDLKPPEKYQPPTLKKSQSTRKNSPIDKVSTTKSILQSQ